MPTFRKKDGTFCSIYAYLFLQRVHTFFTFITRGMLFSKKNSVISGKTTNIFPEITDMRKSSRESPFSKQRKRHLNNSLPYFTENLYMHSLW